MWGPGTCRRGTSRISPGRSTCLRGGQIQHVERRRPSERARATRVRAGDGPTCFTWMVAGFVVAIVVAIVVAVVVAVVVAIVVAVVVAVVVGASRSPYPHPPIFIPRRVSLGVHVPYAHLQGKMSSMGAPVDRRFPGPELRRKTTSSSSGTGMSWAPRKSCKRCACNTLGVWRTQAALRVAGAVRRIRMQTRPIRFSSCMRWSGRRWRRESGRGRGWKGLPVVPRAEASSRAMGSALAASFPDVIIISLVFIVRQKRQK